MHDVGKQKSQYDLHIHTSWSDGDHDIGTIARLGYKAGLKGLVITDHDYLPSSLSFKNFTKKYRLKTIQGVEITTTIHGTDVHILGYAKNFKRALLEPLISQSYTNSLERMKKIAQKISSAKIANIDVNKLSQNKGKGIPVTKYDIIKELVWQSAVPLDKASDMVNSRGSIAYVPYDRSKLPSPELVIRTIHQAGGLAVLAHPGELSIRTDHKFTKDREKDKLIRLTMEKITSYGIDGIEVFTPRHTLAQVKYFTNFVAQNHLVQTGGSDFHGSLHAPQRPLGSGGVNEQLWKKFKRAVDLANYKWRA